MRICRKGVLYFSSLGGEACNPRVRLSFARHRVNLLDNVKGNATNDVGADPVRHEVRVSRDVANGSSVLVANKDAPRAKSRASEGETHPFPLHILVVVVGSINETRRHPGGVSEEAVLFKGAREVSDLRSLRSLPVRQRQHVVQLLGGRFGRRLGVQLLQLGRDLLPLRVCVLPDAAVGAEGRSANRDVSDVLREGGTETGARGKMNRVASGHSKRGKVLQRVLRRVCDERSNERSNERSESQRRDEML